MSTTFQKVQGGEGRKGLTTIERKRGQVTMMTRTASRRNQRDSDRNEVAAGSSGGRRIHH
jgi:hypothetical protein